MKKKSFQRFAHNFFKIFILFMLGIAIINLILYLAISANHKKKLQEEAGYLNRPGELVMVEDHEVHVLQGGDEDSENTLVFLHTSKAVDGSVTLQPLFNELKNCEYIYIERSGYGYSPVSGSSKAVEDIVNEYRQTLKQIGEEGPYTLVSMGTSGVYAYAWAKLYPEEVESIIGVNMNYPDQFADITADQYCGVLDYLLVKFCDMGGHRLLKGMFPVDNFGVYSEEQMKERNALYAMNAYNADIYSEDFLMVDDAHKVSDMGFPEDTDMYLIYANPLMEPYLNDDADVRAKYDEAMGKNPDVDYQVEYNRIVRDYFAKYENVQVVEMSGPDKLYTYQPKKLAELINGYID